MLFKAKRETSPGRVEPGFVIAVQEGRKIRTSFFTAPDSQHWHRLFTFTLAEWAQSRDRRKRLGIRGITWMRTNPVAPQKR